MMQSSDIDNLMYTFDLYRGMQENRLEYIYQGYFNQHIVENLVLLAESNLRGDVTALATRKRLYFLMVESLQNITRHQNENVEQQNSGLFIIRKSNACYFITTGNIVHRSEIPVLRSLLDSINSLSQEELKLHYRKTLDEGILSEKGGAGLGLIGMARKSGNKLEYSFKEVSEDYMYFYLNMSLNDTTSFFDAENKLYAYFENVAYIHEILVKENILLNYCGSFTEETFSSLEEIISSQPQDEAVNAKLLSVTKEMVENMLLYSRSLDKEQQQTTGILFLSFVEDVFRVSTGYYISNMGLSVLRDQMMLSEKIKIYNPGVFPTSLLKTQLEENSFLRIKQLCASSLVWGVQPIHEDYSFITIQAHIG